MVKLIKGILRYIFSAPDENYRKGMTEQELLADKVASRGFIPYLGNGQPVHDDEMVVLMFRYQVDGETSGKWFEAGKIYWGWHNIDGDIIGYLNKSHVGGK